jgi:hypothetical protein
MSDRRLKAVPVLALVVVLLLGASPLKAEDPPAAENPLEPLARLVGGRWSGTIEWTDGSSVNGYVEYEWGVDPKIIKSRTYVQNPEGALLAFEGFLGWHPGRQKIVVMEYCVWGSMSEGIIEPAGDTLNSSWTDYFGGEVTYYRQTLRFLDDDRYAWQAFKKTEAGWEPIMKEATFDRERTPADSGPAARSQAEHPLGQLAWLAGGEWVGEVERPDGSRFWREAYYQWTPTGRALRFWSYITNADGERTPYADGSYTWHPGEKTLHFWFVDAAGSYYQGVARARGNQLAHEFEGVSADGRRTQWRFRLTKQDEDRFVFSLLAPKEGEWVEETSLLYQRRQ